MTTSFTSRKLHAQNTTLLVAERCYSGQYVVKSQYNMLETIQTFMRIKATASEDERKVWLTDDEIDAEETSPADLDRETREQLERARAAQQDTPGPVFTSADYRQYTRIPSRDLAKRELEDLRARGLIEFRDTGVGYLYWGVSGD